MDTDEILYIEALERNTYVYTKKDFYEINMRLYEIEQLLIEQGFIRVSKTGIVNIKNIQSLRADINRKIRVTLVNGEQIVVSRNYADELKKRLGVK